MPGIVTLTDIDAAYIAGLFDGEGSFIIGKHRNKTAHCSKRGFNWELRISCGMTERPALEYIAKLYNKKRLREAKPKDLGGKSCYYLCLFAGELRQTLPQLLKYIKVKKKQGELLLEAITIIGPSRNEMVDERLDQIYNAMKDLNKKGRRTRY